MTEPGVSFIVPVHNGERWLDEVLTSILEQRDGRPFEVIVVDDGSTDRSPDVLTPWVDRGDIRLLRSTSRGVAAALNLGIREAHHPIVCLVDQDVVLRPGWLAALLAEFRSLHVGAVQGYYLTDRQAPLLARVMGLDIEQRYDRIGAGPTNHVCTGNSAYRLVALGEAGLFDEGFGYGLDNDMSYRLAGAGYELRFCPAATSVHRWRETLGSYLGQQYGVGYGRLDVVGRHPHRLMGDAVSPPIMMAHAPLMLGACAAGLVSLVLSVLGLPWRIAAWCCTATVAALALERLVAGVGAAIRHRDAAALLFAPVHLLRDLAWAAAMVVWSWRRLARQARRPAHSMPGSHGAAPPSAGGVY
jgi:GT2 family glycosyltransferase